MGEQAGVLAYVGKIFKQIGYKRNGKYFVRSAPEKVNQTAATRRAADRFGMCSRKSKLIRHAIYHNLDICYDSSHVNRLNKVIIDAAGNHTAIKGFRFNQYAGIDRFFTVMPELSGNGILRLPPQTLAQIRGITSLEIKVIATHIDFTDHQVIDTQTVIISIDPREPFHGADIALDTSGEGTLVVALQVRGMHKDGPSCNRQYLAADIIAVVTPQIPKPVKIHTHAQRTVYEAESFSNLTCHHRYGPVPQRE